MHHALRIRSLGSVATLAMLAIGAGGARAEIIPVSDILNGRTVSFQQCAALDYAVWVTAYNRSFCMRYYVSTKGGAEGRPVVFLQGDEPGRMDPRTGLDPTNIRDVDTNSLQRMADSFSAESKAPAIYLARPGMDGSSGNHRIRHSVLELEAVNQALDAIRRKHNFDGFHLAGQSGGGSLVGALLAMRQDIGCAVPGAGRLASLSRGSRDQDPGKRVFDVMDGLAAVVRNRTTRIIVVTDPQDKKVTLPHQQTFVEALRQRGRSVEHYFVQAIDQNNHGVVAYTRRAMALCLQNVQGNQIAIDLDALSRRRVAAAQQPKPVQVATAPQVQPQQIRPVQQFRLAPPQMPVQPPRAPSVAGYEAPAPTVPVQPAPAPQQMQPVQIQPVVPVPQVQPVPVQTAAVPAPQPRLQPLTSLPRISVNLPPQPTPASAPAAPPVVLPTLPAAPVSPVADGVRNDWPRMSSIPTATVLR